MFEGLLALLIPQMGPLGSVLLLFLVVSQVVLHKRMGHQDRKLEKMDSRQEKGEIVQEGKLELVSKEVTEVKHSVDLMSQEIKSLGGLRERLAVLEDARSREKYNERRGRR